MGKLFHVLAHSYNIIGSEENCVLAIRLTIKAVTYISSLILQHQSFSALEESLIRMMMNTCLVEKLKEYEKTNRNKTRAT